MLWLPALALLMTMVPQSDTGCAAHAFRCHPRTNGRRSTDERNSNLCGQFTLSYENYEMTTYWPVPRNLL